MTNKFPLKIPKLIILREMNRKIRNNVRFVWTQESRDVFKMYITYMKTNIMKYISMFLK